jgi:hypothetical protein
MRYISVNVLSSGSLSIFIRIYPRSRKQEVCAEFGNGNQLQSDQLWDASAQLHPDPTAAASNCAIRECHGLGDGCALSDNLIGEIRDGMSQGGR